MDLFHALMSVIVTLLWVLHDRVWVTVVGLAELILLNPDMIEKYNCGDETKE